MKEEYEFDYFAETSAKTGFNAKEIFVEAAKLLYKEYIRYKKMPEKIGDKLKKNKSKKNKQNKKCC